MAEKLKSYKLPWTELGFLTLIDDKNPPINNMEYFLSRDNSGHWILVPQPIRAWWFKYLEIPDDDERSFSYPEGCIPINKIPENVVFSNFRVL